MILSWGRDRNLLLVSGILFTLLATVWVAPPEIYPGAALLAMLLLALLGGSLLASGWVLSASDGQFLACLAFPLVVSHLLAVNRGASTDSLVRIGAGLLLYAVARQLPRRAGGAVLLLLVAGATVLSLHGLWQYFVGFDLILRMGLASPAATQRLATYRVFSRFLLPSVFASFLVMVLPVAASSALSAGRRWQRGLAGLATVAMGSALLLTGSHGALLALLVVGLLEWWFLQGRLKWAVAVVVATLLGGLILIFVWRGGVLVAGAKDEGPAALRWRNDVVASRMLLDHPLAGVGGGGFGSVYPAYIRPGDNETRYVHNAYLQLLVEHGLPMALPLGLLLYGLVGTFRVCRRAAGPPLSAVALGLAAFLLHSCIDIGVLLPSTFWTAAVLAGLLTAAAHRQQPVGVTPAASGEVRLMFNPWCLRGILVMLMVAGVGAGTASALSRQALAAARLALERGDLATGYHLACRAERRAPWRAEAPLLQAQVLLRDPGLLGGVATGRQAASDAASRAVEGDRAWPVARKTHALSRLALGDGGAAAADLWQAAALYPQATHYRKDLEALGVKVVSTGKMGVP